MRGIFFWDVRYKAANNWFKWVLLGVVLIASGCDDGRSGKTGKQITGGYFSDGVRDLTHDEMAHKAVAAQTEMETGRAPGACTSILLAEGKDLFVARQVSHQSDEMHDLICSMDEQAMTHLLAESHGQKGAKSNGAGLLVDALTQYGPIKADLKYNSSANSEYSDQFAQRDAGIIRKHYCQDRAADSFKSDAISSFKSIMSPVTMDKFNACVRAKSYGFYCDASPTADAATVTIRWEPTELVRSFLPVVALDWSGLANLDAEHALPQALGVGSGYAVNFKRREPKNASIIGATAHDRGNNFNFACRIELPPFQDSTAQGQRGRFSECGVEMFNSGEGAECGAKSFVALRSPECGVDSYEIKRSRACGVESYNQRHDCEICGQEPIFGGCLQCRHVSFGVMQYKDCANMSHGVASYRSCEHPSHGVASYNSCRHPKFGVELYKECEVK